MYFPDSKSPTPVVKQIISSFFPTIFLRPEEQKVFTTLLGQLGNLMMETGYFHLQATKPDTVGEGL